MSSGGMLGSSEIELSGAEAVPAQGSGVAEYVASHSDAVGTVRTSVQPSVRFQTSSASTLDSSRAGAGMRSPSSSRARTSSPSRTIEDVRSDPVLAASPAVRGKTHPLAPPGVLPPEDALNMRRGVFGAGQPITQAKSPVMRVWQQGSESDGTDGEC